MKRKEDAEPAGVARPVARVFRVDCCHPVGRAVREDRDIAAVMLPLEGNRRGFDIEPGASPLEVDTLPRQAHNYAEFLVGRGMTVSLKDSGTPWIVKHQRVKTTSADHVF